MDAPSLLVSGVFLLVFIAFLAMARRAAVRRVERWFMLAELRGATPGPSEGRWWQPRPASIELVVEQSVILLDTLVVSNGKSSRHFSRARSRFSFGEGPRFTVYQEDVLTLLGKALGIHDVELGDPTFDPLFKVKSDDPIATPGVWPESARALMRDALAFATVTSDGWEVTVTLAPEHESLDALNAMIDLAAMISSCGARELAAVAAELPGARWVPPDPPWNHPRAPHVELETPRGTLSMACVSEQLAPVLELSLPCERELAPMSLDIEGGRLPETAPRGLLPESGAKLLGTIERGRLQADGERVCLTFPGIPARAAIDAAVALLVGVASGTQSLGAFR